MTNSINTTANIRSRCQRQEHGASMCWYVVINCCPTSDTLSI